MDNSQFREIAITQKFVNQEIADFEPFLSTGILSLTKCCKVATLDFTRHQGGHVISSVNLKNRIQGFNNATEATACAISTDGSVAVISTAEIGHTSNSIFQHGLTLLRLNSKSEVSIAFHLNNNPKMGSRAQNRYYSHLRILSLVRFDEPILLCFEGKHGYMEVFERDPEGSLGYAVDVFMIKNDMLVFLDSLEDFHEGNSFKNSFVDGFVWSIDNQGKISQLQFE